MVVQRLHTVQEKHHLFLLLFQDIGLLLLTPEPVFAFQASFIGSVIVLQCS